jgi:ferredoxin
MIIILLIVLISLLNIIRVNGFNYINKYIINKQKFKIRNDDMSLNEVQEWLKGKDVNNIEENVEMISVRFTNTLQGKDIVAIVPAGANLLAVGDENGVKLPRACRTGLCGSCTCEVQDPLAIKTDTNPREGYATIRACSSKCFIPPGMTEMVVDVQRMKNRAVAQSTNTKINGVKKLGTLEDNYVDPMARFTGNWEKEFRPQWELAKDKGVGQVGAASNPRGSVSKCGKCSGTGRTTCYCCNGRGKVIMGSQQKIDKEMQCSVCVGMRTVGCGYCRGTGNSITGKK